MDDYKIKNNFIEFPGRFGLGPVKLLSSTWTVPPPDTVDFGYPIGVRTMPVGFYFYEATVPTSDIQGFIDLVKADVDYQSSTRKPIIGIKVSINSEIQTIRKAFIEEIKTSGSKTYIQFFCPIS